MLSHIRNKTTGKYELREVTCPRLSQEVLMLEPGDYEARRDTGFVRFSLAHRPHAVVITFRNISIFFDKSGEFSMMLQNESKVFKTKTHLLNVAFEENLETLQSIANNVNNPENRFFKD